jgi:hypothetical protein
MGCQASLRRILNNNKIYNNGYLNDYYQNS